jgi:hypothetical protein
MAMCFFVTVRSRFSAESVTVIQTDAADLRLPARPFRLVTSPV